eukprot:2929909-Amphidinium_carterae.2
MRESCSKTAVEEWNGCCWRGLTMRLKEQEEEMREVEWAEPPIVAALAEVLPDPSRNSKRISYFLAMRVVYSSQSPFASEARALTFSSAHP